MRQVGRAGAGPVAVRGAVPVAPPLRGASLTALELRNCESLTTEALAAALEACPQLRRLDIVGCESVASLRAPPPLLERLTLDADPPLLARFYSAAARAEAS